MQNFFYLKCVTVNQRHGKMTGDFHKSRSNMADELFLSYHHYSFVFILFYSGNSFL